MASLPPDKDEKAANTTSNAPRVLWSNPTSVSEVLGGGPPPPASPAPSHRCVLFNVPKLLFERRWLGADGVDIELVEEEEDKVQKVASRFRAALARTGLKGDVALVGQRGTLRVSNIRFENKVDPKPILELADQCLWVEPNKVTTKMAPEDVPLTCTNPERFARLIEDETDLMRNDQHMCLNTLKILPKVDPHNLYTTKSGKALRIVEKFRLALEAVNVAEVTCIETCSVCDRIISVTAGPLPASVARNKQKESAAAASSAAGNNQLSDRLASRIATLQQKIAAAKGKANKQKRKRLQRKLKEVQAQATRAMAMRATVTTPSTAAVTLGSRPLHGHAAATTASAHQVSNMQHPRGPRPLTVPRQLAVQLASDSTVSVGGIPSAVAIDEKDD